MNQTGGTPLNTLILKLDLCIAVNCANSLVPQCRNSNQLPSTAGFFFSALFCFKQRQFLKVGERNEVNDLKSKIQPNFHCMVSHLGGLKMRK